MALCVTAAAEEKQKGAVCNGFTADLPLFSAHAT